MAEDSKREGLVFKQIVATYGYERQSYQAHTVVCPLRITVVLAELSGHSVQLAGLWYT